MATEERRPLSVAEAPRLALHARARVPSQSPSRRRGRDAAV